MDRMEAWPSKGLNETNIRTVLQQVRGEGMPQGVHAGLLVDPHLLDRFFEGPDGSQLRGQMLLRVLAREEPVALGADLPVVLP